MDPGLEQQLSALMKKAQDGDRDAYAALLAKVSLLLRDFIRKRVRQDEWVDDVVQDTLISIHRDRHTYDPSRPFSSWMYAIARHRLIDFTRKHRRWSAREQMGETGSEDFEYIHEPANNGVYEMLNRALSKLSGRQREVIQLMKWEGFSVREISRRTGATESSVKIDAHRGYKTLRKLMGESDED